MDIRYNFEKSIALYNSDEEFITSLKDLSHLHIIRMYHRGMKTGWNLYVRPEMETDLKLLGTYDTWFRAKQVKKIVAKAMRISLDSFKLPDE